MLIITLAAILSKIFQASLKTGKFPKIWKEANVTPIFKGKGKRCDSSNYRPISLTAVPCKIMEKLVKNVMVRHLINNDLLSKHQHGFMRGKSCLTNLLECLDIITEVINRGFFVILIFLDFAKAFDCVDHQKLIVKLIAFGFSGELLDWLIDFVRDRRQRVIIGNSASEWSNVGSGVPQGSVLGPLLFLIFINDMPDLLYNICKLFADDSKLIGIIRNELDRKTLQDDLTRLANWAKEWSMSFNYGKCKCMQIGNKSTNLFAPFTMIDPLTNEVHFIAETTNERDLGIQIKHNLKWDLQCILAADKANKMLGTLKKTFKFWTIRSLKILYTSYIRPHLEYACQAWNPYHKKDINRLESIQRRATKMCHELRNLEYDERLKVLNLTRLSDRRKRGDAIQAFKFHKGFNKISWYHPNKAPTSIELPGPAGSTRTYNHRLYEQFTKCKARENFFSNRIVEMWNKLPPKIVDSATVNGFKNRYDKRNNQSTIATTARILPFSGLATV